MHLAPYVCVRNNKIVIIITINYCIQGWKSHLMGSGAGKCLKNARRKQPPSSAGKGGRGRARGIPRAVPAGGAATGSRTNNRPKPK